ncbi:hypothetical protein EXIGLDRAFT_780242, partial [Exidia glandulosa HHB12029]
DFPTYGSGSLHRAGQQHSLTSSGASGSTSFSPSLPLNVPASFAPATSFPPGYGDLPPPAAHQQHQSGASTSSSLSYGSSVAPPQLQPTVSFDDMPFSDYFDLIFGATPPPLPVALASQQTSTYDSTSSSLPGLAASVSVPPHGAPTATYYPPPGPPAQHQGLFMTSLVAPTAQPSVPPFIPAPVGGWGRCRPNVAGRDNRWRYPRREGNLHFMCPDAGCSTPARNYTTVGAVTSHLSRGRAHNQTVQGLPRYLTTPHNRLICPYERCGKEFDVLETGKMDDHVRYHNEGRWCPTCFATFRGLVQNHECE